MFSNTSPRSSSSRIFSLTRTEQGNLFNIQIDGHFHSKIYTSGSPVSGHITITPQRQSSFESARVFLKGTTSTPGHAFRYGTPRKEHTFLETEMPMPPTAAPFNQILQPGESYNIPFNFVIPYQLSNAACKHQNVTVWERHLQLPPSMGSWERDDHTGGSVYVNYMILVQIRLRKGKDRTPQHLKGYHHIKVIPAFPEQPPLHIGPTDSAYRTFKCKTIRKNLVFAKTGLWKASIIQPHPIILSVDGCQDSESYIWVNLEFAPASPEQLPPNVRVKSAEIDIFTDFWLGPVGYLPDHERKRTNNLAVTAPWWTSKAVVLDKSVFATWQDTRQTNATNGPETARFEVVSFSQQRMGSEISESSESNITGRNTNPSDVDAIHKAYLFEQFKLPKKD